MAAPGDCLRAHDDGSRLTGMCHQLCERLLKLVGVHIIRIPSEAGILPPIVRRVRSRRSPPPQIRHVLISQPKRGEAVRQRVVPAHVLDEARVDGISTNLPLHRRIVADPVFSAGCVDIHYLEKVLLSRGAA